MTVTSTLLKAEMNSNFMNVREEGNGAATTADCVIWRMSNSINRDKEKHDVYARDKNRDEGRRTCNQNNDNISCSLSKKHFILNQREAMTTRSRWVTSTSKYHKAIRLRNKLIVWGKLPAARTVAAAKATKLDFSLENLSFSCSAKQMIIIATFVCVSVFLAKLNLRTK